MCALWFFASDLLNATDVFAMSAMGMNLDQLTSTFVAIKDSDANPMSRQEQATIMAAINQASALATLIKFRLHVSRRLLLALLMHTL